MTNGLDTPLAGLSGFQARFATKLKKLGVETIRDLLYFFPVRYEDFSIVYNIADLAPGTEVTIRGRVEEAQARRAWRKGMSLVEAWIADDTGNIRAVWFNQPYLKDALRPGRKISISGKVSLSREGEMYLSHPTHEFIADGAAGEGEEEDGNDNGAKNAARTKHTGRLVPIYRETRGLTSKGIRYLVEPILRRAPAEEWLPASILEQYDLPELEPALKAIHFPETLDEAEAARRRFSFEELFLLQLTIAEERSALKKEAAPKMPTDIDWLKTVLADLPFELTNAQKKALWDVIKDLESGHPMNRLLQGDVGTGKTIVAALTALIAARHGYQTAFMAPTEILARQHFEGLKDLFGRINRENQAVAGFLAGTEARVFYENDLEDSMSRAKWLAMLARGEIRIAVGTHALIQKGVGFGNLGFVVIDEQHRFGVRQRAALLDAHGKGGSQTRGRGRAKKAIPHFLSMSATPIPRTLMLTAFGDLTVSLINEMPKERKQIVTKIATDAHRKDVYKFVRDKAREGRQIFVVCPRIEEVPAEDPGRAGAIPAAAPPFEMVSVEKEYEKLSKQIFPNLKVAMLHGKMKPKEKEDVMRKFRDGAIDILVATSVIEVGVDVPNASVMLIESSDAFGLAQLYQFRGRVGRGAHQSYCFLMTASEKQGNQRLKAIVEARNGFELAERDLKLRGPGQFLGESQTGLPDLAMRNLGNTKLVKETREAALSLLAADPGLKKRPGLAEAVAAFRKKVHLE
jgi:ATP-dependent DNA helicase RecG